MHNSEKLIILLSSILLFVFAFIIIFIFLLFNKRKNKLINSLKLIEEKNKQEILKTQLEVKNETLSYLSQELHDNIGQLLTLSRIHIKQLLKEYTNPRLDELNTITQNILDEIRTLSRSINPDSLQHFEFTPNLEYLLNYLKKITSILTTLNIEGDVISFDHKHQLILYRICQEFITNTTKYANAKHLQIKIEYLPTLLIITLSDDGIGFDTQHLLPQNGLYNMKKRAEIIGAIFKLNSIPSEGTMLQITYPFK